MHKMMASCRATAFPTAFPSNRGPRAAGLSKLLKGRTANAHLQLGLHLQLRRSVEQERIAPRSSLVTFDSSLYPMKARGNPAHAEPSYLGFSSLASWRLKSR